MENCLGLKQAEDVFGYIKKTAELSELRNDKTGEKILAGRLEKIGFIGGDTALAKYLSPDLRQSKGNRQEYIPIFPFGCNNSQYKAVKNAMENQFSVIQGPPGTGKTQTILNIIANILMKGKTVQVVSNNNSAIENVYEKISSPQYDLGFIVASLGNVENKKMFIANQDAEYPDFLPWKMQKHPGNTLFDIQAESLKLKELFDKQEALAAFKQEYTALETELRYFRDFLDETKVITENLQLQGKLPAKKWMALWQECQRRSEENRNIGFFYKIKNLFRYGITDFKLYKQDISKIITVFQYGYYKAKEKELSDKIRDMENFLKSVGYNLQEELCRHSMEILKSELADRYGEQKNRVVFTEEDLWKKPYDVLKEYPVILSTTFSSRNSLNTEVVYDYLIMDEASQVDIATGALALSCARNVIVVGDTNQLPNVITEDAKKKAKEIFDTYSISEGYRFTKSFLQSILEVMPGVTQTLLREHYRCHPKIINFCNQKFYRGELIIMTEDKGEEDVLGVVKTSPGNHARDHYSQRQIDVIKEEIIPKYVEDMAETGIIAPYRNQVAALEKDFENMDIATVHKFQGREKDTIIISTVDDEISDFADDPYLLNVAVSRAKKKLLLVVTGNPQKQERNITDLISYIQYHNFEISDSKIYSVFDYLYKQYTQERILYLKKYAKISEYDSENLMYALLNDILAMKQFVSLDVVCHFPLYMLIKNPELLNDRECKYVMNPASHIDFLIYNRISKKPVLAIEVDGYRYHKENTVQSSRDILKNRILELYEIPFLRFHTNGSGEKERILEKLEEILSCQILSS